MLINRCVCIPLGTKLLKKTSETLDATLNIHVHNCFCKKAVVVLAIENILLVQGQADLQNPLVLCSLGWGMKDTAEPSPSYRVRNFTSDFFSITSGYVEQNIFP